MLVWNVELVHLETTSRAAVQDYKTARAAYQFALELCKSAATS